VGTLTSSLIEARWKLLCSKHWMLAMCW